MWSSLTDEVQIVIRRTFVCCIFHRMGLINVQHLSELLQHKRKQVFVLLEKWVVALFITKVSVIRPCWRAKTFTLLLYTSKQNAVTALKGSDGKVGINVLDIFLLR